MRILLLSPKAGFFGGVEQHVFDIAIGLRQAGHDCHLGFGEWTGRSDEVWRQEISCHGVKDLGAASARTLQELIRELEPAVIYGHKVEAIFGQLTAQQTTSRCLAMVHDHDLVCPRRHKYTAWTGRVCHQPLSARCLLDGAWIGRSPSGRLRFEALRPKQRRLAAARRLDRLVVASTFMRQQLEVNGCDPRRVEVLAPVPRRRPSTGSAVGPAGEEILFVGQLVRGKGCDLFFRALARSGSRLPVRILGDGNDRSRLEVLAADLGLQGRVQFCGWVDNEDLADHYRRARAVVMPGRWPEPFGLVGLEAMANGRPVVAFDVGGVRDWLEPERTGILVPEQDIGALAAAIDRLSFDAGLALDLGRGALNVYHRRFLFGPYIRRLEHLLSAGAAP